MTGLAKKLLTGLAAVLLAGCATGVLGLGSSSWKEEALQHDGSILVVKRHIQRGGPHEIGQRSSVREQGVTFVLPKTGAQVTWTNTYQKDIGYADLAPILVDIVDEVPYLVTFAVNCVPYNRWGRPNPPYVVFRYDGGEWRQIDSKQIPPELTKPNLIVSSPDIAVEGKLGTILASEVAKLNRSLTQPQYKSIVREPLPPEEIGCREMVYYKGGWVEPGEFGRRFMDTISK